MLPDVRAKRGSLTFYVPAYKHVGGQTGPVGRWAGGLFLFFVVNADCREQYMIVWHPSLEMSPPCAKPTAVVWRPMTRESRGRL